jgi:hypothetical protein
VKLIKWVLFFFVAFGTSQAIPFFAQTTNDPAKLPQRDGSHDFDFLIGNWKAHVRRLPDRLNNSDAWVVYDGISNHKKILDSNSNFEEIRRYQHGWEAAYQGTDTAALQSNHPSMEHLSRGCRQRHAQPTSCRGWVHWETRRVLRPGGFQRPRNFGALCLARSLAEIGADGAVIFPRWRKDMGSELDLRALAMTKHTRQLSPVLTHAAEPASLRGSGTLQAHRAAIYDAAK